MVENILIVDDEKGIRESLNFLLSQEERHIDTAATAVDALDLLEKNNYDLIVTDIRMPKMSGIDFMRVLKERGEKNIPIIFLTAYGTIQTAVNAVKEGANDFILKPFDIEHLREVIANSLRQRVPQLKQSDELAVMNEKLDKMVFEMAIIHEIGKTVNSTLDIKKIVYIILETAHQTIDADRGKFFLCEGNKKDIKLNRYYNNKYKNSEIEEIDNQAIEWVIKNQETLVMRSGDPLALKNIDNSLDLEVFSLAKNISETLIVIPFKGKDKILGGMLLSKAGAQQDMQEEIQFLNTLANQASIALENAQLYSNLQEHFGDTIRALVAAVEAKDAYTFGHSDRVTKYSIMIAKELKLSLQEINKLEYLALLHDVGKIGIEETILRKPSKLTNIEWECIKNHAALGGYILKQVKFLKDGDKVIRAHHERFDGSGYPDRLKGEHIPLLARIISVADSFDAMTSNRHYRNSLGENYALRELQKCAGKQFDPDIVKLFLDIYPNKD